jgi:3-hydroxyisobutyrate dehydrogenase-like beta-hydroxyacid dehydrogenase
MKLKTIAVIGTGDMGSAVGRVLVDGGRRVITHLNGRSEHSARLADEAGIENVESLEEVVVQADLFLSIVPPAQAIIFAEKVANAVCLTSTKLLFADCNAVSPKTALDIERLLSSSGATFLDIGIVGAPPRKNNHPARFYASGSHVGWLEELDDNEIRIIDMGSNIGKASALKATYAGLNKGTQALHAIVLLAAERLGVRQVLMHELEESQRQAGARMKQEVPYLAATAERFAGEMKEIVSTYESVGVTGKMHEGAAWLFEGLAQTPLSLETRATLNHGRSLDEAIEIFCQFIDKQS